MGIRSAGVATAPTRTSGEMQVVRHRAADLGGHLPDTADPGVLHVIVGSQAELSALLGRDSDPLKQAQMQVFIVGGG